MTGDDYAQKLNELDHLLNDPDVVMQPALIWRLLGEVAKHEANIAWPGDSIPSTAALETAEPAPPCKDESAIR